VQLRHQLDLDRDDGEGLGGHPDREARRVRQDGQPADRRADAAAGPRGGGDQLVRNLVRGAPGELGPQRRLVSSEIVGICAPDGQSGGPGCGDEPGGSGCGDEPV
jgi:hypothetical protein